MMMRGGTSKGAYFRRADLPVDPVERDDLILRIVGSPDPRQIDGIGGAHVLTTKVAVVSPAERPDDAAVALTTGPDGVPAVERAGIIRTARKLFDGMAFPRPR